QSGGIADGAYGENPGEQGAGRAADAMDAEHVERIVVAASAFEPGATPEADHAGEKADDDAMPRQHKSRSGRDGAEPGHGAGDHAEHRGLAAGRPFERHPGESAHRGGEMRGD